MTKNSTPVAKFRGRDPTAKLDQAAAPDRVSTEKKSAYLGLCPAEPEEEEGVEDDDDPPE
jgi:hypothetical protein